MAGETWLIEQGNLLPWLQSSQPIFMKMPSAGKENRTSILHGLRSPSRPRYANFRQQAISLNMTVAWLLALSVAIVLAAWIRNHPTWPAPQITKFLIYQIACLFVPLACSFFLFRANHNLFGWAALADHIRGLWLTTFSLGVHPNHLVGFIDSLINAVVLIAYALGCWHLQPRHHPRAILVAAFVVVLALWSCQDLLALLQTVDWSHWPKRIQPLMDDLLWGMAMWAALGCAEAALRGEAPFARALWSSSFLFTGLTQAGLDIVDPGRQGRNEWLFTILGSSRMLVVYSLIYAALTMDLYGKRLGIKTLLVVLLQIPKLDGKNKKLGTLEPICDFLIIKLMSRLIIITKELKIYWWFLRSQAS